MLTAALLSFMRMADGGNHISRQTYVILCLWIVGTSTLSVTDTLAWMWVLCVLTMLPTNALLSAINGAFPGRRDGRWNFLQTIAFYADLKANAIFRRLNPHYFTIASGTTFAMAYGAVRASLILPAALWIGEPWLALSLMQGALYWLCGRISQQWAARMSEGIGTGFIGALI